MNAASVAGRYELGRVLGTGGMAVVHEGYDRVLERPVAVKVLAADRAELLDPAARERFGHEARAAARFAHPDAVAMYDAGEADGALYIVMELVVGRSLAERLATEGPLPVGAAVAVAGHVLDALAAAHAAGIVHRDVKPANVLLGDDGTVKLADFGIAKRLDELGPELTGTGRFVGTPRYLAPEQVSGGPATPATDVYAVGVVLFEMLAGSPPFDGGTPLATALAHRDDAAPDVRSIRPEVPPALAAVVTTAMAKRPHDRYPTAAAMRAALAAPAAEPTERMPAPPAGPRSRWPAAALVAVALAAVVAVIAVVFGGDDDPLGSPAPSSAPAATTAAAPTTVVPMTPATTTPATTAPATTPAPTSAPAVVLPTDVAGLIALLAADPAAVGPAGRPLLNDLRRVADDGGDRQAERATTLLERLDGWVDKEQLDPAVADAVRTALTPLAAGDGEGDDDGDG